jgi:hypothetical protein
VCSQEDAALSYHWDILFPPALLGLRVVSPRITGWDSPVLEIPMYSLPNLEDTEAGSDTFWRVRLTVTPLPLEGEEITPAPSVLYFRAQYIQSEWSMSCYNDLADPSCDESCLREGSCRLYCSLGPDLCERS